MSEQVQPPPAINKGLAIASLVLGILSLCGSPFLWCTGTLSVIGIILGVLGIKSSSRNLAIAGIVLSVVGLVVAIILRVVLRAELPSFFNRLQQRLMNGG